MSKNYGVKHIKVTSDGRDGEGFIRYWKRHFHPSSDVKDTVRDACFTPTKGVTYRIAIIMGSGYSDDFRSTLMIRRGASNHGYLTLPFEAACLMREAVSDKMLKRLDLEWLVGMHEPVTPDSGMPKLLGVHCDDNGRGVDAYIGLDDYSGWICKSGFAFLDPKVKALRS